MNASISFVPDVPQGYQKIASFHLVNHDGLSATDAREVTSHCVIPIPGKTDSIVVVRPDEVKCRFENVKVIQPDTRWNLLSLEMDTVWWGLPFTVKIYIQRHE